MWQIKNFEQLSTRELFDIYKLRTDVFIVEQACAYPEVDEHDLSCIHGLKYDGLQLVAYFRLIETPEFVKVGRVVVAESARGKAIGRELVAKAIEVSQDLYPQLPIFAQAQAHLEAFYGSFGFNPISEVYLEDNIPHLDMLKRG